MARAYSKCSKCGVESEVNLERGYALKAVCASCGKESNTTIYWYGQ